MSYWKKTAAVVFASMGVFAVIGIHDHPSLAAAPVNCTSCTPPSGVNGFTWYALVNSTSFTCVFGQQQIIQSYSSAMVGFRGGTRPTIIRYTSSGVTQELTIPVEAACTLRFP